MSDELRDMINAASGFAEMAMELQGSVGPVWHLVTSEGKNVFVPAPPTNDKDVWAAAVRRLCQDFDAVRVVFVNEVWYAHELEAVQWLETHTSLRDYPGSKECVYMAAEDDQGRHLTGRRAIIRYGKNVMLGPLEIDTPLESQGRFVGWLPVRGTRQ